MQKNRKIQGILYVFVMACLLLSNVNVANGASLTGNTVDSNKGSNQTEPIITPDPAPQPDPGPLPRPVMCGDGIRDISEQCDGNDFGGLSCGTQGFTSGTLICNASCKIETAQCTQDGGGNGGGGGGGGLPDFDIFDEITKSVSETAATAIWTTTVVSDARVLYDTVSHDASGTDANYGYAFSTALNPLYSTAHTASIAGLQPGTTYFWRAVSIDLRNKQAFGNEMSFTTPGNPVTQTPTDTTPTDETPDEPVGGGETDSPEAPVVTPSQTPTNTTPSQPLSPRVLGVSTVHAQEVDETDEATADSATTTDAQVAGTTSGNGIMRFLTILLALLAVIIGRWLYLKYTRGADGQATSWMPFAAKDNDEDEEKNKTAAAAAETKKE